MNFWRSFGFYTPSPIDNILEKDSFELEELLEEDDIIHELRVLNKNLLS
jgi:SIT4-associating protein SAP185/190